MCYMIVVAFPPKRLAEAWWSQLPPGLSFLPGGYDKLSARVKHFEQFTIITTMCSCDLFSQSDEESVAKLRHKYEKKGWSKAKIERLANHKPVGFPGGLHPGLRRWFAEAAAATEEAYLFVHWEADEVEIAEKVHISPRLMQDQAHRVKVKSLIHVSTQVIL